MDTATAELSPNGDVLLKTGVPGLDDVLAGGLTARRLYLLEGAPGAGKTTVAVQFLLGGAMLGERVLYITLSETGVELTTVETMKSDAPVLPARRPVTL